jgi:ribulose 1,5-bisphosphate carboxylase large subunit-like protein
LIKLFITWGITVCDGVDFLEDDEETTSEQLQKIHRNTQAITILNSSVEKEEFN